LEDAKVLYRSGRYARAYALGVLSAEEFAKAYIYKGFSKGWIEEDKVSLFRDSLTWHSAKIELFRILASITYALYSDHENWGILESGKLPEKSKWDEAEANKIWKMFESSERLKEDAFYVSVRGRSFKTPKSAITWQMSKEVLDFMTRMTTQYDIQHQEFHGSTFKAEGSATPGEAPK
jgi:AbiV family abortive infection protein